MRTIDSALIVPTLLSLLLIKVAQSDDPVLEEPDADEQIEIQDMVNTLRLINYPRASDMQFMAWNPEFAAEAKKLAMQCVTAVSKPGVILAANGKRVPFHYVLHTIRAEYLFSEIDPSVCKSKYRWQCISYRDILDPMANGIGCVRARCANSAKPWLIYCVTNAKRTNEPFDGLFYQPGTPCQRCPATAGYCYYNLCVSNVTKAAILKKTPSSMITCDAPCMNCGVRTDSGSACYCKCPIGYNSEVDCSMGSGLLTCSACRRSKPCRNGGREVGTPPNACLCLCSGDYGGEFCEIPIAQIVGGVSVRIGTKPDAAMGTDLSDRVAEEIKEKMTQEINKFCRDSHSNYLECCGSGTLPTNGPLDFVDADSVYVMRPITSGYDILFTIYATAKGNNGLCRKRTAVPSPVVAVPAGVIEKVIIAKVQRRHADCCKVVIHQAVGHYREYHRVPVPTMNCLSLRVG